MSKVLKNSDSISSWSIKRLCRYKKSKDAINLLENNQDLTFKEIAKKAKIKLEKVYLLNNVLENERKLEEGRKSEEEKAERVLRKMNEHIERKYNLRLQVVEKLYFEEGMLMTEISQLLRLSYRVVHYDIKTLNKRRNKNEK